MHEDWPDPSELHNKSPGKQGHKEKWFAKLFIIFIEIIPSLLLLNNERV